MGSEKTDLADKSTCPLPIARGAHGRCVVLAANVSHTSLMTCRRSKTVREERWRIRISGDLRRELESQQRRRGGRWRR